MLRPTNEQRQWLLDIVDNIDRIERHRHGLGLAEFDANETVRDAVERCLQRVTEAVIRLGDAGADLLPDQDLKGLRGLGNFLRHKYDRVDANLIWEYLDQDAPMLREVAWASASINSRTGREDNL